MENSAKKRSEQKQELSTVNMALYSKDKETKSLDLETSKLKEQINNQDLEIYKLKKALESSESANDLLQEKNNHLMEDISSLAKNKNYVEQDNIKIQHEKEKVSSLTEDYRKKCLELEARLDTINELYEKEKLNNATLNRELDRKDTELMVIKDARNTAQKELDKAMDWHSASSNEKKSVETQLRIKELELQRSEKKVEELSSLLNFKEYKEEDLKKKLTGAEIESYDVKEKLRKVQKDKELYEAIADRSRKEAELNKQLRQSSLGNTVELINEKKKLESKLLEKEIEASRAKRELNLVKDTHEGILEDKIQKEMELNAIKDHVNVLESQNMTLSRELDKVVESDDKIKQDLDRKNRISYIKEKNENELQRSAEKVRMASPDRTSPSKGKSPYKSPYKSPNK